MASSSSEWIVWALLSAIFAALTAIFAKVGIQGVDSDLATLVRTVVVILSLVLFVWFSGKWSNPFNFSVKTWMFLILVWRLEPLGFVISVRFKLAMPLKLHQ